MDAFFDFVSTAMALKSTSLEENFLDFRTPPRFTDNDCESAMGILFRDSASLASLFRPGILGVAERMREITPDGPREPLRPDLSSVSTRRRLLPGRVAGMGRFVTAPGRDGAANELVDLTSLGLAGDGMTGPPNFRLIESQCSGRRAEKLLG
jgi:hypothetical protein